jgi:uncharacterized surface protein with fasciclin (FAS1) repeats
MSSAKSIKKAPSSLSAAGKARTTKPKTAAGASKPKSALGTQYEATLLDGEPEEITNKTSTTRTVSRVVTAPAAGVVTEMPITRLTRPRTIKPVVAEPSPKPVAMATTTCTTEVVSPVTVEGVEDKLESLGYEVVLGFVAGKNLEAVYAITPLGQKAIIRTSGQPRGEGEGYIRVEGADDSPIGSDVSDYFLRNLITEASLGGRIDTDFAIMTADGFSVWADDGTSGSHWLYAQEDVDLVAAATGLEQGWFVLSSVMLDALKEPDTTQRTIIDKLYSPPRDPDTRERVASFRILIQLLRMAGLLEPLRSAGPFTLLAPDDAAFAQLDDATARALVKFENRDRLAAILEYHIYANRQDARMIGGEPTVQGELITWDKTGDTLLADEVPVEYVDLEASNGIVHILSGVLEPDNPMAGTLTALVEPVSSDDIDYATWRIRRVLEAYQKRQVASIAKAKDTLDMALEELTSSAGRVHAAEEETLRMTQRYNNIAENPSKSKEALDLAGKISLENDQIDAGIMSQNENQSVLDGIAALTVQAKALSLRLRRASIAGEDM